jgi:hypothetical protein
MGGSGGWAWGTGGAIVGATTGGSGTGQGGTGGISANHTHDATTGDPNLNHTHGVNTDNGSSQTNWTPRYVDLIMCIKD